MEGGVRGEEGIHHKGTKDTKDDTKVRADEWIYHEGTKDDTKVRANELSRMVIGAAIEVHRTIGPGLLESAYLEALCRELHLRGIPFERQVPLPMEYKGIRLECSYRLDLVVHDLLIVELKSVERIEPIYEAQLLTYLRLKPLWLGLLINFNVPLLKEGVRRIVNG